MADNRPLRFGTKKAEPHASKKRKMVEKVVMVKLDRIDKRAKSEGPPPSDSWSWRKYGQKPIKGSPFPRGYYRCSTSKGCTAKKQVERCKTDASKIIVTYTSSHNHPITKITESSEESSGSVSEKLSETQELEEELENEQKPIEKSDDESTHLSHPVSQINVTQEFNPLEVAYDSLEVICKEQPLPNESNQLESSLNPLIGVGLMDTTSQCAEEPFSNADYKDIYDELDELPTASCLTELMGSNFFDERILVEPF